MARKIVNRRELREQADAASAVAPSGASGAAAESDAAGSASGKRPAKAAERAPRKSRAKKSGEVRLKAFWGVFNQSLKRVALYEYSDRKQADKKAAELSASGKSPHFVKAVKEAIEE
jgi:hypothetical protein